jgi:hypothetical protein
LAAQGLAIGMRKGGKAAKWAARSERLSAALRENLKRRKAQARGRAADPSAEKAGSDGASGAQGSNKAAEAEHSAPDFRRNRSND